MIFRPLGCSLDVVIDTWLGMYVYIQIVYIFAAWYMLTLETNVYNNNKKENEKYQCGTPRGLKKK